MFLKINSISLKKIIKKKNNKFKYFLDNNIIRNIL